jgi:peroxisomal membrane protein 4
MLSLAKLSVEPNMHPLSSLITPEARAQITNNAWPAFASLSWAFVMYLFRWYPETLASSLRSSMVYMCVTLIVPSPLRQFWPCSFPDHFD